MAQSRNLSAAKRHAIGVQLRKLVRTMRWMRRQQMLASILYMTMDDLAWWSKKWSWLTRAKVRLVLFQLHNALDVQRDHKKKSSPFKRAIEEIEKLND